MTYLLDDEKKHKVECLAKVCRIEKDEDKKHYDIVAYFLDLSSADRAYVDSWVKQRIKKKPEKEVQKFLQREKGLSYKELFARISRLILKLFKKTLQRRIFRQFANCEENQDQEMYQHG